MSVALELTIAIAVSVICFAIFWISLQFHIYRNLKKTSQKLHSINDTKIFPPLVNAAKQVALYQTWHQCQLSLTKSQTTYWANQYTLLGAIRHGGLRYWDTTISVSVVRQTSGDLAQTLNEVGLYLQSVDYNTVRVNTSRGQFCHILLTYVDDEHADPSFHAFGPTTMMLPANAVEMLLQYNSVWEIEDVHEGQRFSIQPYHLQPHPGLNTGEFGNIQSLSKKNMFY